MNGVGVESQLDLSLSLHDQEGRGRMVESWCVCIRDEGSQTRKTGAFSSNTEPDVRAFAVAGTPLLGAATAQPSPPQNESPSPEKGSRVGTGHRRTEQEPRTHSGWRKAE